MTGPQTHETPLAGGVSKNAEAGGFGIHANPAVERLQPDLAEAERFLTLLDESAEAFCFRTFPEIGEGHGANHPGALDAVADALQRDNARGRGVYVVVNEGGNKAAEITRVRAVFADFDPPKTSPMPEPSAFPLEPHIMVESSPGKHHVYWLVDGLPLDEFTPTQEAIVARFGSDASVCDRPRVMRVPGFIHRKAEPFRARIIHESGALPYTAEAIRAAFSVAPVAPKAAAPAAEHGPAGVVVDVGRHNDARTLTGRMAREVARGLAEETAWQTILAERERGRWTRAVPDKELRSMFDGALAKLRAGEWSAPASGVQQIKAAQDARKASAVVDAPLILPAFPADLLALPHGLGQLQQWILGYMTYPSPAMAGFTAWATLAHFAMSNVRVDSRRGLGLNEQFLLLAPTGFGKEDMRAPFEMLGAALQTAKAPEGAGNLWLSSVPTLQFSAPASQQGLHKLLEAAPCQSFLADEFAEWLGHAATDSHKQQALGHIMQAYSKAFGTLAAPAAAMTTYKPVQCPRVLVFATSTAERLLESINASQADSGALNRFVIMAGEQDRLPKRYDVRGEDFKPPLELVDLVAWVAALKPDTVVSFSDDARALYEAHDQAVLDPLKFRDNRLAGRLNEQAFKLAALIALSDRRTVIDVRDLDVAYKVREGLYHRAASMIGADGALSGMHSTGRALEQIRQHLTTKQAIYRSNLPKLSRQFAKLSVPEQEAVIRALVTGGIARVDGGRLVSEVCDEAAA